MLKAVADRAAGAAAAGARCVLTTTVFAALSPSRCLRFVAAIITSPIPKKSTIRSRLRMLACPKEIRSPPSAGRTTIPVAF
jgi:hypothetical protein